MDSTAYFDSIVTPEERRELLRLNTLAELMERMEAWGDRAALSDESGFESYMELIERVSRVRGFFAENGVSRGDFVGVYMKNCPDFPRQTLAIITLGAVAVLIPPQLPAETVAALTRKFNMKRLVCGEGMLVDGAGCPADAPREGAGYPAASGLTRETPAAVVFSGGTTGAPKGALLSHGGLMRGAFNGAFAPSPVLYRKYLALIPMTHVFGLVRNMLSVFLTGGELRLIPDARAAVRNMAEYKPNILILVPALVEMLYGMARAYGAGVLGGELDTVIAGAAPVKPSLIKAMAELGIRVLPGYGLTETCNLVSGNGDALTKPDSVGVPYPAQELRIVDGELRVKGDHLMLCYVGDEEATREAFDEDGFFRTGDLACFDEDGFLYITGRSKNVIITDNGENVSPEAIEARLNALAPIKDSLVFEGRNALGRAVLLAELLPEGGASEADVRAAAEALNAELPPYERIAEFTVRSEDFQRTGAGKIVRPKR